MNSRRVVITGMGAITPLGADVPTLWAGLAAGKSGIRQLQSFDTSQYDCKIGGEVLGFEPAKHFKNPKEARRTDRYAQLAMAAAKEAIAQSGIESLGEKLDRDRVGVIVGSGIGGLQSLESEHKQLITKGPARISPFMIPMMISNMASGMISMELGYRGPNFSVVTACATANNCIGEGWRLIRDQEADVIVAGGSEAACINLGIGGFAAMRALSLRNDEPEKASRPFDRDRDGFVMAEGAGVVVLEEYEHAKKRGAVILGELTGYGLTADAHHLTAPAPEGAGAQRAMKNAMNRAGLKAEEIGYINAHGTSTPQGDIAETQAVKHVFGAQAKKVPMSSTKSMTGHLLGAAGAVELIACIKAIETGILPPTINLDNPDAECDLDYVPHKARESKIRAAMSNSFGFGGHNACLIVEQLK